MQHNQAQKIDLLSIYPPPLILSSGDVDLNWGIFYFNKVQVSYNRHSNLRNHLSPQYFNFLSFQAKLLFPIKSIFHFLWVFQWLDSFIIFSDSHSNTLQLVKVFLLGLDLRWCFELSNFYDFLKSSERSLSPDAATNPLRNLIACNPAKSAPSRIYRWAIVFYDLLKSYKW